MAIALITTIACAAVQAHRSSDTSDKINKLVNTRMEFFATPVGDLQELIAGQKTCINLGFVPRDNAARELRENFELFVADRADTAEPRSSWSTFLRQSEEEFVKPSLQEAGKDKPHWMTVEHPMSQDDVNFLENTGVMYAFLSARWRNVSGAESEDYKCMVIPITKDSSGGL